jgi:hypothetical protein
MINERGRHYLETIATGAGLFAAQEPDRDAQGFIMFAPMQALPIVIGIGVLSVFIAVRQSQKRRGRSDAGSWSGDTGYDGGDHHHGGGDGHSADAGSGDSGGGGDGGGDGGGGGGGD